MYKALTKDDYILISKKLKSNYSKIQIIKNEYKGKKYRYENKFNPFKYRKDVGGKLSTLINSLDMMDYNDEKQVLENEIKNLELQLDDLRLYIEKNKKRTHLHVQTGINQSTVRKFMSGELNLTEKTVIRLLDYYWKYYGKEK